MSTLKKEVNLDYLIQTMGGNKKLIAEIMDVFLIQCPKEIEVLNIAVASEDYNKIRSASHAMKSSASIMGISSVSEMLKQIEELAINKNGIQEIRQLNAQMYSVYKLAMDEIASARKTYL